MLKNGRMPKIKDLSVRDQHLTTFYQKLGLVSAALTPRIELIYITIVCAL